MATNHIHSPDLDGLLAWLPGVLTHWAETPKDDAMRLGLGPEHPPRPSLNP